MTPVVAPRSPRRRWVLRLAALVMMVVLAVSIRLFLHSRASAELRDRVERATAPPTLAVTYATAEGLTREVKLPGNLASVKQTTIFARASGYVRAWYADIGARVREGDVLAALETPELDQQLEQARATLAQKDAALKQAEANNAFLQLTAARLNALYRERLVAQQDADQANAQAALGAAGVEAAKSDVAAQTANVRQLVELVSYGQVRAPFTGVISQRLVDIGSLVNAGASQGGALFELQASDPLRVFIQVPQTYAPSIRVGTEAKLQVRQYTDRTFLGKVTRSAGALDPATRTLLTEVQIPNPAGELLPGMYADVTLPVAVSHPVVKIPSSAVIYDASGLHVAVIENQSRVHLVAVRPGRDDGTFVEIVDGLVGGERVVVAPPADLVDGMKVATTMFPMDGGAGDAEADGS